MRATKAWYLAYFASLSCIFPFLNLFFRRLGLGERAIGALGAARPLISLPAGALWSGAADKSRRHRAVLLGCFAASVAARLSIAPVGAFWAGSTAAAAAAAAEDSSGGDAGGGGGGAGAQAAFVPLLCMVLLTEFFAAPVTIVVDAAVMAACSEQGEYGKQRLFGALGWGLFSALAGSVITHAGIYAAFACHALLTLAALPPTLVLPFGPLHAKLEGQGGGSGEAACREGQAAGGGTAQPAGKAAQAGGKRPVERFDSALEARSLLHHSADKQQQQRQGHAWPAGQGEQPLEDGCLDGHQQASQQAQQQPGVRYWAGVARLLRCPEAAVFLALAVFMGVGVGNIEGYLFLFLDELGGSELLMGLSLSMTCAAETLVFYFLPRLLRLGFRRCMHLVLLAFLLRMLCYAALPYAPTPWLVLPVEVLHGFTFALAWGAGCAYCQQLAPPGLEATSQGLFQGLYFGLGVAAGSTLGGQVYQRLGAQAVYLVACCVLAAGWLLCSLAQLALHLLGYGTRQGTGSSGGYLQVEMAEPPDEEAAGAAAASTSPARHK
ncbi:hypothetical protein ABPG75_002497 [Micractinium tetrahymenae]